METVSLSSLQASIDDDSWRRLESYLGNVEAGYEEQLKTPFYQGNDDHFREYAMWYYDNIAKSDIDELNEIELDEVDNFGPFSTRLPWEERKEGVLEYFQNPEGQDNAMLKSAFMSLSRLIPSHSLTPLTFKASFGAMPKDANLGLPFFSKDKIYLDSYLKRAESIAHGGYKERLFPSVLGWRGQANGDPSAPKQRVVWMQDHCETIIGLSIQVPLLEKLRKFSQFAAWNQLSRVDEVVTAMIDSTRLPIMSLDFSGFDKRYARLLNHLTFELMRYWFVHSAKRQLDWLEQEIETVPLVVPSGIITGNHGMPSGSALTNLGDSLGQLLMILPFFLAVTVLGDDGVGKLNPTFLVDPETVTKTLFSQYGAVVSADKGGFSSDQVRYLQRLHLRKYRVHGLCVGIRSLTRTWNGACHLERRIPDLPEEFFSARTISQLENAKYHPRFRKAVEYFYSIDRVVQEFDPVEIFTRAGGVERVEKVLGLNSYKFGSELPSEGLNSFATVIELRKLRQQTRRKVT